MSPAILTISIFFLCILSFIWEKIPLAVSGRITSKKVRQPLAPRSEEASNKV